jgi:tetratricopeptide (TPR) repeat protein
MDPTSIALGLAMVFGLIGADAVMNANTIGVQITVPAQVAQAGMTREFAEDVFANEVHRINRVRSLLEPPTVRSSSEPTVVGVLAKSLNLDDFTFALQDLLGLGPVRLSGAVLTGPTGQRLLMTASSSAVGPFTVDVRGEADTDALLRRGAFAAMQRLQPYRAALHRFVELSDEGGTDFAEVQGVLERELGRPARPETVAQRAFMHNLLGIIGLMRNDLDLAERGFQAAIETKPDFGVGHLNLAFLRVHQDRYDESIAAVRRLLGGQGRPAIGPLAAGAHITWGVAAWGLGQRQEAARLFEQATRDYPGTTHAYEYWALLLRELGREAEADEKARIGAANEPFFENFPEVAMLYFWLDPHDQVPLRRR